MTMNERWGYMEADDAWKDGKTIVRNLVACASGGDNYLLNIGPKLDGSVPESSVHILTEVGTWMDKNELAIYGSEPCKTSWHRFARFSRKGNGLYIHIHLWPAQTLGSKVLGYYQPSTVVASAGCTPK
jgi:alpha-L-fucosidase